MSYTSRESNQLAGGEKGTGRLKQAGSHTCSNKAELHVICGAAAGFAGHEPNAYRPKHIARAWSKHIVKARARVQDGWVSAVGKKRVRGGPYGEVLPCLMCDAPGLPVRGLC